MSKGMFHPRPSFRSRRNTISHGETQTQQTNKTKPGKQRSVRVPCVGLSYVKLCDTAALVWPIRTRHGPYN